MSFYVWRLNVPRALRSWIPIKNSGGIRCYRNPRNPSHFRLLVDPRETLRPEGVGTFTHIPGAYPEGIAHWDAVDDVTPDEDETYVNSIDELPARTDTYLTQDTGIPVDAIINWVRVYNRVASVDPTYRGYCRTALYTHGTLYVSEPPFQPGTAYENHYTQYDTNPYTGEAWTVDELNAMEIGVNLQSFAACILGTVMYLYYAIKCTQVFAVVDYTIPVVARIVGDGLTWVVG